MGTKREELESTTGCLAKAADDEPIFVLRAQDATAPMAVRNWIDGVVVQHYRDGQVMSVKLRSKLEEARRLAVRMEQWQRANPHLVKVPD